MKVLSIAVSLILLISILGMAQQYPTDKGVKIISGGAAFSSAGGDLYEEDNDRIVALTVQASPSVFIAPGVAGGASVAYVRNSVGDESFSQIGFGPHLALFLTGMQRPEKIEGTTYPYIGATFLYNIYTSKYTSYSYGWNYMEEEEESDTENGTTFSFGIGIMHMITRTFAMNAEIAYQVDTIDNDSGNRINVVIGFSGLVY